MSAGDEHRRGASRSPAEFVAPAPRVQSSARQNAFLKRLHRMSAQERLRASRAGGFDRWERGVWARHYPEEVPVVNGELEWIALGLADLD
jgi:hypothetical protein